MRKLIAMIVLLSFCSNCLYAVTYYVSSKQGDDRNAGNKEKPWKTLARLGTIELQGHSVLLAAKEVFEGNLDIRGQGKSAGGSQTVIGSYGEGRATIRGGTGHGIWARDVQHLAISNIALRAGENSDGYGLLIENTRTNGTLDGVQISDVEAEGFGKHGMMITGSEYGFDNVRVENCSMHGNKKGGIEVAGKLPWNSTRYAHSNVVVRNCVAFQNSGDPLYKNNHSGSGIVLYQVDGGLIESCAAWDNGASCPASGGGPVGIWTCASRRVSIQFCQSFGNKTRGLDGGGFDIDGGSEDCVLQYNYSHDNFGPGLMVYTYPYAQYRDRNNTVRYNLSVNDGVDSPARDRYAGLWIRADGRKISGVQVYNNTVITRGRNAACVYGDGVEASIQNNVFLTETNGTPLRVEGAKGSLNLKNNLYWSSGAPVSFIWNGANYKGLPEFQSATGEEKEGATSLGFVMDPGFRVPGMAQASPLNDFSVLAGFRVTSAEIATNNLRLPDGSNRDLLGTRVGAKGRPGAIAE